MADLKIPTTFLEQLERLKSYGVVVTDDCSAMTTLENINYYRLTAYLLHKRDVKTHLYEQGTNFDMMVGCLSLTRDSELFCFMRLSE